VVYPEEYFAIKSGSTVTTHDGEVVDVVKDGQFLSDEVLASIFGVDIQD
jgi:hypothetical protein